MNFSRILTFVFVALLGSQVGAMDSAIPGGNGTDKLLTKGLEAAEKFAETALEKVSDHPYFAAAILTGIATKYVYNTVTAKTDTKQLAKAVKERNLPFLQAQEKLAIKAGDLKLAKACKKAIELCRSTKQLEKAIQEHNLPFLQAQEQLAINAGDKVLAKSCKEAIEQFRTEIEQNLNTTLSAKTAQIATEKKQTETAVNTQAVKKAIVTQAFNCTKLVLNDAQKALLNEQEVKAVEAYNATRSHAKVTLVITNLGRKANINSVGLLATSEKSILAFVNAYNNLCKTLGA